MPADYAQIRSSQMIATHATTILSYALNAGPIEDAHLVLYDTPDEPQPEQRPGLRILATAVATPGYPDTVQRPAILARAGVYAQLSGGDAIAYIVTQDEA